LFSIRYFKGTGDDDDDDDGDGDWLCLPANIDFMQDTVFG